MKKFIALFLALFLVFGVINTSSSEEPQDLTPTIQSVDYSVTLSNLSQFSLVALRNAHLDGHVRGSIWVGGTLTGGDWKFVDDGSIGGKGAGNSYVATNESTIQFKGRTSEQGPDSYYGLTEEAISNTRSYWKNLINNIESNDTWIYVAPDEEGKVDMSYWDYQCPGSDESQSSIEKIYWTDATSVTMGGLAGHLIAPKATVTIVSCNHCGSIVAKNITTSGESHINYWNPSTPPTPPTPTPKPITVTKVLKGEIWQVRCDVMDNTTFTAGGGRWMADITNSENITSKEGHRSNHCGNGNNWVLFVSKEGEAISLYQLKSGSTGGTLPSIVYRAPADLSSIPEGQLIYDPTDPNDVMTARLINEVFRPENAMPFSEIKLQEGRRLFWISQNGKQTWHHTGVLKVTNPKFAIVINGEVYSLGVGDTITLTDIEEGLVEVDEIATANYKLKAVEYDEEGNVTVINEIDPPDKPTPTPPPSIVTPTPTPDESPTPSPTPEESPTPSPTPSESPTPEPTASPTPILYCSITIRKVVEQYEGMEPTIFYFKISGNGLEEPIYVEVSVNPDTGVGAETISGLKAGKYTVEEVDIPKGYILISDGSITQYYSDDEGKVAFKNQFVTPTPSPSPSPTPDPTPSPSPTPSSTITPTESPSPSPTPSETPTEAPTSTPIESPTPSPSPTPDVTPTATPAETPTTTPTITPTETPTPTPVITETPSPTPTPIITTPTPTPVITETPSPSPTPIVTVTPSPTPVITETPSPTPIITSTPSPTETPSPTPRITPTPKPTATPTITPAPTATPIPVISIGVHKIWNDISNAAIRPDSLKVKLYADGERIQTVVLNDENHWTLILEVPKYNENGQEIVYTWKESEVAGYKLEETYTHNRITTFVNKPYENPPIPPDQPQPKAPTKPMVIIELEDYKTALGIDVMINHVGDCFD